MLQRFDGLNLSQQGRHRTIARTPPGPRKPRLLRTSSSPSRWKAVRGRDARFDGVFVYGVRSTGIYCHPSCPARRPHRKHVIFYETPADAEAHGFRACRRCHPDVGTPKLSIDASELIKRVCGLIEGNRDGLPSAAALGKENGMPAAQLQRMFRRITGISMRAYADAIRVRRLKQQLRKGDDVTTALYDAGYGSSSRLYENSDRQLGMTPATYRRGGKGMEIGYTIAKTALGRLLLAGTARGISAIYFGDSDVPLIAALKREYPFAEIKRQPAALSRWVQSVVRHVAGGGSQLDLPVDVQATAFQRRVWEELQRIPYGATRSYSEVARSIGQPTATRAVARARATNPVCVLIPCHRVVRENGGLAGYRWGIGRKRELIEAEKRNIERTNRLPGDSRSGTAVD